MGYTKEQRAVKAAKLAEQEKLEKQVKFMLENDCAFSFTGYEFADENGIGNGKIVKVPEKINIP